MAKIVVPTQFNKTGKRILTTPVDNDKICAPANRKYKESYRAIEARWKSAWERAKLEYTQKFAHRLASYIANEVTPVEEKYRIAKFLVEQALATRGPMPLDNRSWSAQLGGIPALAGAEEDAWRSYLELSHEVEAEKETAIQRARRECDHMKRALRKEFSQRYRSS
ncbi:MAG: hypothetical protein O2909_06915 [Chloroflexi bacterium]|nr:hypothetical protein [Chloroflexota bacterium]MDA1219154.1 hypothetical protein [Chloroflexota bacterium]PKB57154.1 MAG: hypothetical protein BZY73_04665 [SAR202 cluster bacterium Casp-Chloro-G3]